MAHFAELDQNNIVLRVVVVNNDVIQDDAGVEQEQIGVDYLGALLGGRWVQTSYNARLRKNYAGKGYSYDASRDAFIPPQPFPSWELDEETCNWVAPVPYPNDEKEYIWNEENIAWVAIT